MKKTKDGNRRYSEVLKRKVAEEYVAGKFSYAVGAELYGLKDKGVVKEFVKWYRKKSYLSSMELEERAKKASSQTDERIEQLEAQLKAARLEIACLESLIEIAEKELSIDLRKKSGTKQSN